MPIVFYSKGIELRLTDLPICRVINKQENDQDEGAPLDLENEWKVLETE